MRLHKPVRPQHQPHHAQSFAKTDTYAGSGQDWAAAGDHHASAGAGFHGGGIPADGRHDPKSLAVAGAGFADGGSVSGGGDLPPVSKASDLLSVSPSKPGQWSDEDEARRIATDNTLVDTINSRGLNMSVPKMNRGIAGAVKNFISPAQAATDDGGSGGSYADGGAVDPKAYLQWPEHLAGTVGGFAAGGAIGGALHPAHVAQLAAHSKDVYNYTHKKLEAAFNAHHAGQQPDAGLAQGGGIPAPPGPAGAGVKPQSPTGNAGRPNWTAPNPTETASEKNYTQNVSSRPATSPARGTAFSQAGPDGGQRGQEWYGKGASPYGAGRKKQNGV